MGIYGRDYRKNVKKEDRRKDFDITTEYKKSKKAVSHDKSKMGSYQNKKNVYDRLDEAMETHGQTEAEKDIFED
jgi:hypothetical protein